MKIRLGLILALIVLFGTGITLFCREAPTSDAWFAASMLSESKAFGFGPQGCAAEIGNDEKRFFTILDSPKSQIVFRHLYDTGTPAAKAYAIVGLKQTYFGRGDKRIDDFAKSGISFMTLSGCFGQESTAKELLYALDSGYYTYKHRILWKKNIGPKILTRIAQIFTNVRWRI